MARETYNCLKIMPPQHPLQLHPVLSLQNQPLFAISTCQCSPTKTKSYQFSIKHINPISINKKLHSKDSNLQRACAFESGGYYTEIMHS